MAKDPAFLFYASDFLTGTFFMTDEQVGKYIRLLCVQHQHNGSIAKAAFLQTVGSDKILAEKFKEDENGYFNERMREEMAKRREKSEKMSANAKQKHTKSNTTAEPIENENINRNEIVVVNGIKGVQGENWDGAKLKLKSDWRLIDKLAMDGGLDRLMVLKRMDEFLADIELKEDYKDFPGLKKHFINWHKKHHNGSAKNIGNFATVNAGAKLGTSDARTEALRKW